MQHSSSESRRSVITFVVLTFCLSSIFYLLIIHTGKIGSGFGRYVTGLMWCPGIAALITLKLSKRKISDLGWQWGKTRYQVWSFLIPLLYTLIAYIIIWAIGWGGFYNIDFVNRVSASFGFDRLPKGLTIIIYFLMMGIYGLPGSMATGLGEEIGWRGFLVPELFKTMSYTKTSIITGIIWALWHYPFLLFTDYNSGTPAWYALSCFTLMIISSSFIHTWFRLKSKSLWPSVILHASHNCFLQSIFTPLTTDTGHSKYFIDEFGIILPTVCLCVAFYFWTRRNELLINRGDTIHP